MESLKAESLPPPPGVIGSIKAGFDTTATHLTVIFLPLVLDLFLWLGPRLSMEKFYLSLLPQMTEGWRMLGVSAEQISEMVAQNAEVVPQINLFWLLRTIPIGISSLLFTQRFSQTPAGDLSILEVHSGGNFLIWMFLLTLLGWFGGGLYFRSVSRLININGRVDSVSVGRAVTQTVILSLIWAGTALIFGLPIIAILVLLAGTSTWLGQAGLLLLSFVSMWLIVPLFFWPHGVFIYKQNVFLSIFSSFKLARFTLPTSSMFVLTIFLLTIGLNYLWSIPSKDSWMMLVGVFGHAFVSTALLAGSFIYYRDLNVWLQTVMQRIKTNSLTKA